MRDFNPRSLVGNDDDNFRSSSKSIISIHVPSWGTTDDYMTLYDVKKFQSTFPRGERPQLGCIGKRSICISIHVPSWGTTIAIAPVCASESVFQSTFPRGERPSTMLFMDPSELFQSTFPRGERHHLRGKKSKYRHHFNPRSLVGNDGKFSQIFFVFLCNKYNFSTFYYPFSLFFSVIHVTFLIFVVRILPAFYVYF